MLAVELGDELGRVHGRQLHEAAVGRPLVLPGLVSGVDPAAHLLAEAGRGPGHSRVHPALRHSPFLGSVTVVETFELFGLYKVTEEFSKVGGMKSWRDVADEDITIVILFCLCLHLMYGKMR